MPVSKIGFERLESYATNEVVVMENLDENRVPKAWIGREVVVRTRGSAGEAKEMFGKLEDVHEGGVVLSGVGPTQTEAEPVLFYSWSAMETLRLQVPPTERPGLHEEEPRDRARAAGRSRRLPPPTEPKLMKVVPIAQRSSTAGVTITLRSLEIYEGGHGLLGYLVSHTPRSGEGSAAMALVPGRSPGTRRPGALLRSPRWEGPPRFGRRTVGGGPTGGGRRRRGTRGGSRPSVRGASRAARPATGRGFGWPLGLPVSSVGVRLR